MRPFVAKISPLSDYYVYSPSEAGRKLYLYPLYLGHYFYEAGYYIKRNSFDGFQLMYIVNGNCDITIGSKKAIAGTGSLVLLDLYLPHCYGSTEDLEVLWLHFDGVLARNYFQEIINQCGFVLKCASPQTPVQMLEDLIEWFRSARAICEPTVSQHITNLLNCLLPQSQGLPPGRGSSVVVDSLAFINEHFREPISLREIAEKVNLSLYHFSRIFTAETGFTPHQYLINMRISAAKLMLLSSDAAIKDIAFSNGFSSESHFCATFKKAENMTPNQYRSRGLSF